MSIEDIVKLPGNLTFMKKLNAFILVILLFACHNNFNEEKSQQRFYDSTIKILIKNGANAYLDEKYKLADSLLTQAISISKHRLSVTTEFDANPYYYRASNDIEMGKYEQALSDIKHVATDSTTNTHVLLIKCNALRMSKKYDQCISVCNKLIELKYDSVAALSEREQSYYYKQQYDSACYDLNYCKQRSKNNSEFVHYLDQFTKKCSQSSN